MTRLILFFVAILAVAVGLDWLADRPGTIVVEWQGYVVDTSVFRAFASAGRLLGMACCFIGAPSGFAALP